MIKIKKTQFSESEYQRRGLSWSAPKLYEYVKEQEYEQFSLDLRSVDIGINVWDIKTVKDFIFDYNRVVNCDSSIPILLDDEGFICDGWHRLVKAITLGNTHIQAIRIEEMPQNDGTYENP